MAASCATSAPGISEFYRSSLWVRCCNVGFFFSQHEPCDITSSVHCERSSFCQQHTGLYWSHGGLRLKVQPVGASRLSPSLAHGGCIHRLGQRQLCSQCPGLCFPWSAGDPTCVILDARLLRTLTCIPCEILPLQLAACLRLEFSAGTTPPFCDVRSKPCRMST